MAEAVFQALLESTSRSFSLGIRALEPRTRAWVREAYLLCRVFDTFEDVTTDSIPLRLSALRAAGEILDALEDSGRFRSQLATWDPPRLGSQAERELLARSGELWAAIGEFPAELRAAFRLRLRPMVDGMLAEIGLQGRPHLPGRELADTDRYCYFVAGTVGELLTEIFAFEGALREEASSAHFAESVDFGKALQLVNIAKDFHGDLREGRCFWPGLGAFPAGETPPFAVLERSFRQLEERFRTYRQKAWDYMRRIDKEARPDVYRFCVFPLRMAEETMDLGGRDLGWLAAGGTFKVSRLKTLALAAEAGLTL